MSGGELTENQCRARRVVAFWVWCGIRRVFFLRCIAAHGEIRSCGTEGEGLDAVNNDLFASRKIQKTELSLHGLLLFLHLLFLRLGVADGVSDPARVRRKRWLRAERGGFGGAVGDVCDAQLVFPIGTVDGIGYPLAVRRKTSEFARHG